MLYYFVSVHTGQALRCIPSHDSFMTLFMQIFGEGSGLPYYNNIVL